MLRITGSPLPSQQFAAPTEGELARLRAEFSRRHCLVLPGLLDGAIAEELARRIDESRFYRREDAGIGVEACMEVNATHAWLLLLVNDQRMLEVVRSITGCGPIGFYDGRVYRHDPRADHHDSWHDDVGRGRLVALSINVGRQPYEGGELEIRERDSSVSAKAKNAKLGDGLLFEIAEGLEHRVLPVTGTAPRTVFAGWFTAGPSFLSVLRSAAAFRETAANETGAKAESVPGLASE